MLHISLLLFHNSKLISQIDSCSSEHILLLHKGISESQYPTQRSKRGLFGSPGDHGSIGSRKKFTLMQRLFTRCHFEPQFSYAYTSNLADCFYLWHSLGQTW